MTQHKCTFLVRVNTGIMRRHASCARKGSFTSMTHSEETTELGKNSRVNETLPADLTASSFLRNRFQETCALSKKSANLLFLLFN